MFSELWSKKRCWDDHNKEEDGLRSILTNINANSRSLVIKPIFLPKSTTTDSCCYLKSCHLCHKPLPLDKEVYMYRGDLGFCSVVCRDRQIYLDETEELELSTKRIFSYSFRRGREGCHTNKDFRYPLFSSSKNRVVFS